MYANCLYTPAKKSRKQTSTIQAVSFGRSTIQERICHKKTKEPESTTNARVCNGTVVDSSICVLGQTPEYEDEGNVWCRCEVAMVTTRRVDFDCMCFVMVVQIVQRTSSSFSALGHRKIPGDEHE